MPRQDPPSVRGLADLLGLNGPPGPPRPDAQRELFVVYTIAHAVHVWHLC